MAKPAWKPWHEVVKLRDDVRTGDLSLSVFAADLYDVAMKSGSRPIYEKPEQFFSLTYPTFNLRRLAKEVVLRLAKKNDKAVRQLELTYGGGKTHALITLYHLVNEPEKLPKLPAVDEFIEHIGQKPPKCRIACLCFDKLDVEKGMEILSPDGKKRMLKNPWSVLAYQIAGDDGLKILHANNKAEERNSPPAENLLVELLRIPGKNGLGTLILIDEVLMYAREKVGLDREWRNKILDFFQYLTQAVSKVDSCCIVASLLATDPRKSDTLGREIQAELYDIFRREREEAIEPVVKDDVAELLRRRFFTAESLKDKSSFRSHVVAALKGISSVDEQTSKNEKDAEDRFEKSFPFHPDLTEVFYSKWTQLSQLQRARGVLRIFALALRDAEKWDKGPLIGPAVFLADVEKKDVSDALGELISVADTEETEGRRQVWKGIIVKELEIAKETERESLKIEFREIEQAVIATFLHSQPIGQSAKTRDIMTLVSPTRPDKIELEKGLHRWSQASYWLDDLYTGVAENQLPSTWRLGNKPNLTQMHATARKNISDTDVFAQLLNEIGRVKPLSSNASAAGVRVHVLPSRPKDIEDDGQFHYAILGPNSASESGKPNSEARRYLDETTGSDKPRVYRNAVLLLVPSKDGLVLAHERVRDFLAWTKVNDEISKQQKDGSSVDPARMNTLRTHMDTAKGRVADTIRHAYCIVVTVSEKNEVQAFKITIEDKPHFDIIKKDKRSRLQETAVTADALLPDGPYNLWLQGDTFRRVKDLAGAFAQNPALPKMLKASAILETLADGCERGIFVLRLTRPDGTKRTWWMSRPDENALKDSALELVLTANAELTEISYSLLAPKRLPGLWNSDDITVGTVQAYFNGSTVVQVDRGGYAEQVHIPKAAQSVIEKAIAESVEKGLVWLLSGPASVLGEPLPAGILDAQAKLCPPPANISPAQILPENLPAAWKDSTSSALAILTALSLKMGKALPWKTVRDVITAAVNARFLELAEGSQTWPCDFPSAQFAKFKQSSQPLPAGGGEDVRLAAEAELKPEQIQDLADIIPQLLRIRNKGVPLRFRVRIELGDGKSLPSQELAREVTNLLTSVDESLKLQ